MERGTYLRIEATRDAGRTWDDIHHAPCVEEGQPLPMPAVDPAAMGYQMIRWKLCGQGAEKIIETRKL